LPGGCQAKRASQPPVLSLFPPEGSGGTTPGFGPWSHCAGVEGEASAAPAAQPGARAAAGGRGRSGGGRAVQPRPVTGITRKILRKGSRVLQVGGRGRAKGEGGGEAASPASRCLEPCSSSVARLACKARVCRCALCSCTQGVSP